MLAPRLYRAAFAPVLFALALVAFSLHGRPPALSTTLSTDAFDGSVAALQAQRWARDPALANLRPGAAGDIALAGRVSTALRGLGFSVSTRSVTARTVEGRRSVRIVSAERTGFSTRRLVVVAFRDGPPGRVAGALADTSALLELGRVLGGRTLGRTLDLVSVSGRAGGAGAQALASSLHGSIDAVLVLGDLGGAATRRPWVIPYGRSATVAPLGLRRTVESALRSEVGGDPGAPGLLTQFARLAFPLTLGAQGALLDAGIPAVELSVGGERAAAGERAVDAARLEHFGRGALRALTALDAAPAVAAPSPYLVLHGQVLPASSVRLVVGVLLLPLLLVAVDGLARVNRRRLRPLMWLRWIACTIVPFVLVALFLRLAGLLGLPSVAPPGPAPGGAVPLDARGILMLVLAALLFAGAWFLLRPALLKAVKVTERPAGAGPAGALAAVLALVGIVLWIANPFAAALVVPALHLWLLAIAPELPAGSLARLALIAAGLLPALGVAALEAVQLGWSPIDALWMGALQVTGGGISLLWAVLWSVVLGTLAAVVVVARGERATTPSASAVRVRGPGSYAGPGSLGGTESALRR